MANPPPAHLQKILRKLWESDDYHDLTIHCGHQVWNVHRAIICPHSEYFTKACTGGFKEAAKREIVLEGDEPELVERMLEWLYTREYIGKTLPSIKEDMVTEAKMYAITDKYGLGDLKEVAKMAFAEALGKHWDTDQFVVAVEVVYTSTPDSDHGLRDVVTTFTWGEQKMLLAREDVQELLKNLDGFSKDLLWEICKTVSRPAPPIRKCSWCRTPMVNMICSSCN